MTLKMMVSPPILRLLPCASLACTVTVVLLLPLAVTVAELIERRLVAVAAAPGTKVTSAVSVMPVPLRVPEMVMASATVLLIVAV